MSDIRQKTREYLADWVKWIDAGAPQGKPYMREDTLCFGPYVYLPKGSGSSVDMSDELEIMFKEDGLDSHHPFYDGTRTHCCVAYKYETDNKLVHTNEKRVAWARKHSA